MQILTSASQLRPAVIIRIGKTNLITALQSRRAHYVPRCKSCPARDRGE